MRAQSLKKQFPYFHNKIKYKLFKFKDGTESDVEPYIRINVSPQHLKVIAMDPMNSEVCYPLLLVIYQVLVIITCMQIKASDIDFWKSEYDVNNMRRQHAVKVYPPRVKMTIPPCPGFEKLQVKFEGCLSVNKPLDVEFIIPLTETIVPKFSWPRHCSHEQMCCKSLHEVTNN